METKTLIAAYYAAFNAGRTDEMLSYLHDEIEHHVNEGGIRRGKEKFAEFNAHMTRSYREELTDIVIFANEAGDRAAAEFVVNGTYLATDEGLPPANGQTYVLPAGAFFEIRDGKVARISNTYNLNDWIAQVGA